MHDRRLPPARGASVRDDWRAWLPEEKSKVFCSYCDELEQRYAMLSIPFNEAIDERRSGELSKCFELISIMPGYCLHLTTYLAGLLRALHEHAKHYGTMPSVRSLDSANFAGVRAQRSARMSGMLSRILLPQRAQFLHKLNTLHDLVEDLYKDFSEYAMDLGSGAAAAPASIWQALDSAHYDLNTCLREAVVLLKCFLLVLPSSELASFQKTVRNQMRTSGPQSNARDRFLRNRRMAQIAGE